MTARNLVTFFAVLLGLAFGSFSNVVIHRVPLSLSVVSPPSACPQCGAAINSWQNIPIVSWLVLRGRCAHCRVPIAKRYPLVEALVAGLFAVVAWWAPDVWTGLLLATAALATVILGAIDLDVRRLPRVIVAPWAIATGALILAATVAQGDWWLGARALIGAASLGAFYFVAFVSYPKGLGWGDVTVAPILGAILAFMGWPALVVGAFSAFVWGLLGAIVPMVRAKAVRGVSIPFGPSMFLGAATGIVAGPFLADWYLGSVVGL